MSHKSFLCFPVKGIKIEIIGLLLLLVFLQSSKTSNRVTEVSDSSTIATVNGKNITAEEFSLFINQNRAMTYNYFDNKYGIDRYSRDFWNSQFGLESPTEYIREIALQECILVKLQQLVAQERGIISEIDYSSFKDDLAQENTRRKLVKQNGGILYGPVVYNTQMYYNHVFSQMLINLKRDMAQDEFKISDMELSQEYEVTKMNRFRNRDQIQVEIITPRYDYETIFIKLSAIVNSASELENLIKLFRDKINIIDMQIDEDTYDLYSRQDERLLDSIYQLKTGQSCMFTVTNHRPKIIRCNERSMTGFKPFDQVKDLVRIKWINDRYRDWLNKLERQADIQVNEKYLDEVLDDLLG